MFGFSSSRHVPLRWGIDIGPCKQITKGSPLIRIQVGRFRMGKPGNLIELEEVLIEQHVPKRR